MKRRQAKKILKTWPRQRHATLRRAVGVFSRSLSYEPGSELSVARGWIRRSRTSGSLQLSQWLLRLSQAREISRLHSREPREDVAEMLLWARESEEHYLAARRGRDL